MIPQHHTTKSEEKVKRIPTHPILFTQHRAGSSRVHGLQLGQYHSASEDGREQAKDQSEVPSAPGQTVVSRLR